MTKVTKKEFCIRHPQLKKLRRTDPLQFNVLYYEWYRIMLAYRWSTKNYLKRIGLWT